MSTSYLVTDYYGTGSFTMSDTYPEVTTVTTSGGAAIGGSATLTTTGPTPAFFTSTPNRPLWATQQTVEPIDPGQQRLPLLRQPQRRRHPCRPGEYRFIAR